MSALTHNDIGEMVRRRFNGPPEDVLRYVPLVDSALRDLAYEVAANHQMRHWLLTDPASTTVALDANGVADLSPLITSPRILLECLKYGNIFPPVNTAYPTQPFRMIDNPGQGLVKGMFDSLQPKCWMEGVFLHTKRVRNAFMSGSIALEVPYWPTLAQLPEPLVHKLVHGNYWQAATPEKDAA